MQQEQGPSSRVPDAGDTRAVDELLSKQLQQLSFQDREMINEEIHGVVCLCPDETPEMLVESLRMLTLEIDKITSKVGYNTALTLFGPTSYVNTDDFRLKFLRSELFDPKKAAIRLVNFLDLVLEYYGTEALRRPIMLSDLGKEEIESLRAGNHQILPFRDRSGRKVVAIVNNFAEKELHARVKLCIYLFWVAAEDVESQRKGVVFVFWPGSATYNPTLPDPKEHVEGLKVNEAVPFRPIAYHVCFPDTYVFRMIRSALTLMFGGSRLRMRFHNGDTMELQYKLLGYGIPVDLLPVTETGNVKTRNLLQWIKVRKVMEEGVKTPMVDGDETSCIEIPGLNDVIFRYGKSYLSHPGNVMFRGLIEAKHEEHNDGTTDAKLSATWWVVDEVLRRNGRFLAWDNQGFWVQLQDKKEMRAKVAIAFKEYKKKLSSQKNRQVSESSTFDFERQDGRKRKRSEVADNMASRCLFI